MILARGGTEDDIREYAREHGADLTRLDTLGTEEIVREFHRQFPLIRGDMHCFIISTVDSIHAAYAERDRERVEVIKKMKPERVSSHGSCCTCDGCGQMWDDCVCTSNKVIDGVLAILKNEK